MAKVIYEGNTFDTVSFTDMKVGQIGIIVSEDYKDTLVMKCNDGGSGVVVRLDGGDMWANFKNNPLQVRILGKDESVELTNQ